MGFVYFLALMVHKSLYSAINLIELFCFSSSQRFMGELEVTVIYRTSTSTNETFIGTVRGE